MKQLPKWSEHFSTFPMRRQGELDGACSLYCLIAVAAWWSEQNIGTVSDPEKAGYLAAALPGHDFDWRVLSSSGLDYKARRTIAARIGLDLRVPKGGFSQQAIIEHFNSHGGPLLATVEVVFRDPLRRIAVDPDNHAVVIVTAKAGGLLIADPHPWNDRLGVWKWSTFAKRVRTNNSRRWWVERVVPRTT